RDEGVADLHDQLLGPGEDGGAAVVAADDDLHLADGLRAEARDAELSKQAVTVWDPSCSHRDGRGHVRSIPRIQDRKQLSCAGVTQLYEPATGAPLAEVDLATTEDVDRAVAAARAALGGDWRKAGPTERSRLLHALADALVANRKELAELEARNVGKAIASVKAELGQAV